MTKPIKIGVAAFPGARSVQGDKRRVDSQGVDAVPSGPANRQFETLLNDPKNNAPLF